MIMIIIMMMKMIMMMMIMMTMMMMRIDRSEDLVISAAIMAGFLPAADTEELRHMDILKLFSAQNPNS